MSAIEATGLPGGRTRQARVPLEIIDHAPSKDALNGQAILDYALQHFAKIAVEVCGPPAVLRDLVDEGFAVLSIAGIRGRERSDALVLERLGEPKFGEVDTALGGVSLHEISKEGAHELPGVLKPGCRRPIAEGADSPAGGGGIVFASAAKLGCMRFSVQKLLVSV